MEAGEGYRNMVECNVKGVTTKGKITSLAKHWARRSPEESLFLDDLITFIVHVKAKGTEELFSFSTADGSRVVL